LSLDVEAMLAGQAMKTIEPEAKNPGSELWDRVFQLMALLL
jgi:hypothetical protein